MSNSGCRCGLLPVLLVGATLSASADNSRSLYGQRKPISSADAIGAVVEILRGSRPENATHTCWGAAIACHNNVRMILTAAHCVLQATAQDTRSLYVKLEGKRLVRPNRMFVHPRFNLSHLSANYDLATLEAPLCAKKENAIPITSSLTQLQADRTVIVLDKGRLLGASAWSTEQITEVTATSLTLADNPSVCLGSSGAPVLLDDVDGYSLIGVISSGPSDCSRGVKVARTSAALHGFLDNVIEGKQPIKVRRTCGECIEQSWEGDAPCVTSINACRHDVHCTAAFACTASHQQEQCSPVVPIFE